MTRRAPHGRPTIYRGADGLYHTVVEFPLDPITGKRRRRHIKRASRKEVASVLAQMEQAKSDGLQHAGRLSLDRWFAEWLATADIRQATKDGYRSHYRCYIGPCLGSMDLSRIGVADVEAMMRWMVGPDGPGVSVSTAESVRRTLRAALNTAIRHGRLSRNPAALAKPLRGQPMAVSTIDSRHIPAIVDVLATHPDRARYLLALTIGARQGEILGLRRKDVNLDGLTITISGSLTRATWRHGCADPVACAAKRCRKTSCRQPCTNHTRPCPPPCPTGCTKHASTCPQRQGGGLIRTQTKTGRVRTVAITVQMAEALREHLHASKVAHLACGTPWTDDGYVFCYPDDGRPINSRTDWGIWSEILRRAGVPHYRLYSARHYAATTGIASGVSVNTLMAMLGWTSPAMVQRYAHVVDESKRAAAEMMAAAVFTPAIKHG